MKKSVVFIALLSMVIGASAQTMKVQSAYSDMKNERLASAKQNIDDACVNEKTKDDPKTWNYAGLIYAQIVDASANNQKLFKKQKIDTPVETLCRQGIESFKKSLELEKKAGTNEYTSSSINAMKVLCGYQFVYAAKVYNEGKYQDALPLLQEAGNNAEIISYKNVILDSKYYQADCYRLLKDNDNALKLYRELAKLGSERSDVYLRVYADNKAKNDTIKAINSLKAGIKNTIKDTANIDNVITLKSMLAGAYFWANNQAEAEKLLNELLAGRENNTHVLNSVAQVYVDAGNVEKATTLFNKSIAINSKQVDPYRGVGLLYYNNAVDCLKKAADVPMDDQATYDKFVSQSNEQFKLAIPHFTKALEIKDNDFQSLKALKTIYSKLQMTAEYQVISNKLDKLLQK